MSSDQGPTVGSEASSVVDSGAEGAPESATTPDQRPALRIVKGNPAPEEIAALVAVFSAVSGGTEEEPKKVSAWASPAEIHRTSLPVGATNAWVLSGR